MNASLVVRISFRAGITFQQLTFKVEPFVSYVQIEFSRIVEEEEEEEEEDDDDGGDDDGGDGGGDDDDDDDDDGCDGDDDDDDDGGGDGGGDDGDANSSDLKNASFKLLILQHLSQHPEGPPSVSYRASTRL